VPLNWCQIFLSLLLYLLYFVFWLMLHTESTRNSLKSKRVQKQAVSRNKENNFWLFKELLTAQSIFTYTHLRSLELARMQRYRFVSEYFFSSSRSAAAHTLPLALSSRVGLLLLLPLLSSMSPCPLDFINLFRSLMVKKQNLLVEKKDKNYLSRRYILWCEWTRYGGSSSRKKVFF
jgi:hypothetical protein